MVNVATGVFAATGSRGINIHFPIACWKIIAHRIGKSGGRFATIPAGFNP